MCRRGLLAGTRKPRMQGAPAHLVRLDRDPIQRHVVNRMGRARRIAALRLPADARASPVVAAWLPSVKLDRHSIEWSFSREIAARGYVPACRAGTVAS